jgi:hypothetical protein
MGLLLQANQKPQHRIMVGVPMTGLIRAEWAMARYGQTIPCNWSNSEIVYWYNQATPLGYAVAEARNIVVDAAVSQAYDWLLFIDHDVILPPTTFVKLNQYMLDGTIPVVSGLYCAKAHPPEPLLYRGRGNGYFTDWKLGEKVWVDGVPMGCTLIHVSILREMTKDAPKYLPPGHDKKIAQIFDTPAGQTFDPVKESWTAFTGTEDLAWCNRVMEGGYLKRAGFPKIAAKKYPFLMDTSIFCKHITPDGTQYPLHLPLRHKPLEAKPKRRGAHGDGKSLR